MDNTENDTTKTPKQARHVGFSTEPVTMQRTVDEIDLRAAKKRNEEYNAKIRAAQCARIISTAQLIKVPIMNPHAKRVKINKIQQHTTIQRYQNQSSLLFNRRASDTNQGTIPSRDMHNSEAHDSALVETPRLV